MKLLHKGTILAWVGIFAVTPVNADEVKLDLPVFPVPSLSAFTPPVIKAKGFDKANGLDLNIVTKAATTYRTDFAAGTDKLGGSGTVLADVAKLNEKGVKTIYLFNVFDYWGTVVVPAASEIRALKDLNGKSLAASLPTTNYALFRFFAQSAGVDLSSLKVQGSPVPGLVPMAVSGRVDAVQMWEPAHSVLTFGNSDFRALDLVGKWKQETGFSAVPYLGIAAHKEWVDENAELIPKLFQSYKMAAEFISQNPAEAAQIISDASEGKLKPEVLINLIKSDRLAMNVYWGNAYPEAANAVFKAATETAYLTKMPASGVLYGGN